LFDDEDQAANNDSLRIEIQKDSKERERIFSYIGGEEINKDPRQIGHRYAIDANDIETESDLSALKGIYSVITSKVKPGRLLLGDNPNNTPLKKYWWRYQAHRPQLYDRIRRRAYTLAIARVTPYVLFSLLSTDQIFSEQVCVIDSDSMKLFSVIQSRAHELWALHLSSSMGDTLRYTPSDVFATFPVPLRLEDSSALEAVGAAYHLHRAQLMIENDEGLTRTYNRFHDPDDMTPGIVELRRLHDAMDQAVMTAYGWDSALKRLAVPGFEPLFDEDEDEATARRARKKFRYRWPEEVRDEVLARLLALNAERATEERKALESGADESAKRTPAARGKGRRKASGMNDLLGDA
jgi:hypothetical protein